MSAMNVLRRNAPKVFCNNRCVPREYKGICEGGDNIAIWGYREEELRTRF